MLDHAGLLARYVGHRVCVTLYGQNKVWGRVANVCHDSMRLVDTSVVNELDEQEWLNHSLYADDGDSPHVRYSETVVQLNHIVSITCVDTIAAPSESESTETEVLLTVPEPRRLETTVPSVLREPTRDSGDGFEPYAEQLAGHERIVLEVDVGLLPLVRPGTRSGSGPLGAEASALSQRLEPIRRSLARDFGVWLPPIRIQDCVMARTGEYRILLMGNEVLRSVIPPKCNLCFDLNSTLAEALKGDARADAHWVPAEEIEPGSGFRMAIVDGLEVLIHQLTTVVQAHADELLSLEDVKRMVDRTRSIAPTVVEEIFPHAMSLGVLRRILGLLLAERVPIRNLVRILESLASASRLATREVEELTSRVRADLGWDLCGQFLRVPGRMPALVLDATVEQTLWRSVRGTRLIVAMDVLEALSQRIRAEWRLANTAIPLVVDPLLRRPLRDALVRCLPELTVLAYNEIPSQVAIETQSVLTLISAEPQTHDSAGWMGLMAPETMTSFKEVPQFAHGPRDHSTETAAS